jgi:hypothetical protein
MYQITANSAPEALNSESKNIAEVVGSMVPGDTGEALIIKYESTSIILNQNADAMHADKQLKLDVGELPTTHEGNIVVYLLQNGCAFADDTNTRYPDITVADCETDT